MDHSLLMLQKQLSNEERLMFQSQYDDEKKTVSVGVLLALLLGGTGAHQFYLGDQNKGILYLCMGIGGILLSFLVIPIFATIAVSVMAIIDAVNMGDTVKKMNRRAGQRIFEEIKLMRDDDTPPSLGTLPLPVAP